MFAERAYLLDVTNRAPKLEVLQELLDILAGCNYNVFCLYSGNEPLAQMSDVTRVRAYCQMQGLAFERVDAQVIREWERRGDTVLVSTEATRSLTGRVEEMRERMAACEDSGRRRGVRRFVVTDFSDGYDWQPPAVSLPGIVLGGAFATVGRKAAHTDIEQEMDRILCAPIAGLILKLGTLYLRGGARLPDSSEFFNILAHDHGYSRYPGLTQQVLEEVAGIARAIRVEAERWVERTDWAREVVYMANLLECACYRRDERRLRALRDEHGRIWRLRFMPEGRVESLARLPRF